MVFVGLPLVFIRETTLEAYSLKFAYLGYLSRRPVVDHQKKGYSEPISKLVLLQEFGLT